MVFFENILLILFEGQLKTSTLQRIYLMLINPPLQSAENSILRVFITLFITLNVIKYSKNCKIHLLVPLINEMVFCQF